MKGSLSKLMFIVLGTFLFLVATLTVLVHTATANSHDTDFEPPPLQQYIPELDTDEPTPIITDPGNQHWVSISGDCIAYRDENGGVFLHNLTTSETITVTDKQDEVRKVVISQGIVVWRSEGTSDGKQGLWGYYNPDCNDAGVFGDDELGPFYIVSRAMTQAPAISGEMVTFDTWAPVGAWYIAMVELDKDDNGIPDATETGYDPADGSIIVRLSCCGHGPNGFFEQRLSDVYWDNDYKIACWAVTSSFDVPTALTCNNLHHYQEPKPFEFRFRVNNDTNIAPYNFDGIISIHRDLVVWTGSREPTISGFDLYIADLDIDDDKILNHEDPDFNPDTKTVFTLVNMPWDQTEPDIDWPFVVWTENRHGNQKDIYAYDLSLDSNNNGIPNWQDPTRNCQDQAEFSVLLQSGDQSGPEISGNQVVWIDQRNGETDIYGSGLSPVVYQPRIPFAGSPEEKARHWLEVQTVRFLQENQIPGYTGAPPPPTVIRYKSFMREDDPTEYVIQTEYKPITGSYVVSYDTCRFGTPDQKRFLGRYGRGFIYDQGLAMIAHTLGSQFTEAEEIGRYVSSFQNTDALTYTTSNGFGFSFNGQGYWGEKDNFYDVNYLRAGANGWLGYGYLLYSHHASDTQFIDVMTTTADYILAHQILDETDERYGLFTGGYGRWFENIFFEQNIQWISVEHNIDIYFFLRDLGLWLNSLDIDGNRYLDAADLLKAHLGQMWNEGKGRLDRGLNDDTDVLDAASWGSMYWSAIGDLEKAELSLIYADEAYKTTLVVSDTVHNTPQLEIWGYQPQTGNVDEEDWTDHHLIWSEGSLGVAMANLKLGHDLIDECNEPYGQFYINRAEEIMTQMTMLQTLDPEGGLLYAINPSEVFTDFIRTPSAAGTTWFLMTAEAINSQDARDAFWGPDIDRTIICPPPKNRVYLPITSRN